MNKKDVQKKYTEIKAAKAKAASKVKTLFGPPKKQGCSTCGKVTWKPKKNS
ncbi:hypothetical protein ACFQPF_09095 [Fictibacillus iocasae]|uniref:Uncharacterized protein n=1 Tax=Fictibacillus iocasae TaxID=2715437 RepID=A0ABW2NRJ3_9BACL